MRNTLLVKVDWDSVTVECSTGDKRGVPVPRQYRKSDRWHHPDVSIVVATRPGVPLQWERANSAIMSWLQDNNFPISALRYHRAGRKQKQVKKIDGYEQMELW